jgi:Protein of unknown function (DUF3175)
LRHATKIILGFSIEAEDETMMAMSTKRWSARVSQQSDALTLEAGVFTKRDPRAIARSLKRSAEHSRRRKSTPFRSAMSMLNFYINRMGRKLNPDRRKVLERAKVALRELFGKNKA